MASSVHAVDQPISGHRVKLMTTSSGARVVFVSKDAAVPFPAVGSGDDPTGVGMIVEVFTAVASPHPMSVPSGAGHPGWRVSQGSTAAYRYRNPAAGTGIEPIRRVTLAQGRALRLAGVDPGLALVEPLGAVAIRVTVGSLRSCALFDGASVRMDVAGRFSARDASAPAVPDCDDATLLSAVGLDCGDSPWPECGGVCPGDGVCAPDVLGGPCRCISPTQPCGETAPLCSGVCPAGEQCYPLDDFFPGTVNACACAPIGEPPCGTSGLACDATTCPPGLECTFVPPITPIYDGQCSCLDPGATCGPGFGTCPPDLECIFFPPGAGGSYSCLPIFCGGTYPTCESSCSGGRECVPLDLGSGQFCVCATPSLSCDEGLACGEGLTCPEGEVCTLVPQPSGPPSCSCEPL
jgi:hypothetical protein